MDWDNMILKQVIPDDDFSDYSLDEHQAPFESIPIKEFQKACKVGAYNSYDGEGILVVNGKETNISIWDATSDQIDQSSHVNWYNK